MRGPRSGERLASGWHLRWPFLESIIRFPQGEISCSGEAQELTREGAMRARAWSVSVRADLGRIERFAEAFDTDAPCTGVAARVAEALGAGADSPREAMRATLEDAGLEVLEAWSEPSSRDDRPREVPQPAADARRVLLVGLDGADWLVLDPLIDAGLTPNLARLKAQGAWAALRSNTPMLSPLLWTTAVTGRPPEEHGIVDFLIRDPATGARVPISSNFRRTKALWNILSDAGLRSDWVAWWATWPAERIHGRMVSDRVAYSLFGYETGAGDAVGATWPRQLLDDIHALRVTDAQITLEEIQRFARVEAAELDAARRRAAAAPSRWAFADPLLHLTRILASTATYHRTALSLLETDAAMLTAVYYQGIDEVGHRFAHCMPPRMSLCSDADFARYRDTLRSFYRHQDALLGELLERAPAGTITVVLSDHGFLSGAERPAHQPPNIEGRPGEWHRSYGVFLMHGPGVPAGRIDTVTLYDVAPTVLHLLGLPAGEDMRGEVLAPAKAVRRSQPARIASWEEVGVQAAPSGAAPASIYDEEVIARLRSLGYIQGVQEETTPAQAPLEGDLQATAPGAGAGSVTYHTNLGVLYLNRGEAVRAEVEFRRALEQRPSHPDAVHGLARTLLAQSRAAEARAVLEPYLEHASDPNSRLWLLYAAACQIDARVRQGLRFIDRQGEGGAGGCRAQVARSRLLFELQDLNGTERTLRRALETAPECLDAMEDLFGFYEDTRQPGRQDALMAEALRARPDSPRLLGLESLRQKARGNLNGAERTLRRALNLAPDDPMLLTNFGSLLGISG
ncbi:MAG: alkaline phosphatase family protein, partial [Acidobacteriota bacterium]